MMNIQYSDTINPRCQEINRQVKLAEKHQQAYYRDEPVQRMKKGPSVWSEVRNLILALAARITLPPRPSAYFGRPVQHSRSG